MKLFKSSPKAPHHSPKMEEIEPRILYSADLAPVADEVQTVERVVEEPAQQQQSVTTESTGFILTEEDVENAPVDEENLVFLENDAVVAATAQEARTELLVINSDVEDYESLIEGIDTSSTHLQILVLNESEDPFSMLQAALSEIGPVDTLHIVTHGEDAALRLGDIWINDANLDNYRDQFSALSSHLATDADILLYGCDIAETSAGESFVDTLSLWTGADIAASNDLTGHNSLGGDWELEYSAGAIETVIPFSEALQQNWNHVLDVTVDATSNATAPTAAPSDTASHTTSGSNRLMLVGVSFGQDKGDTVASVTYNGVNLSFVGAQDNSVADGSRVEIWSLIAPDVGTHNVVVTYSGTNHIGATTGVVTFNGVDQSTPLGSFASSEGDSSNPSTSVSSATGEIVFGAIALDHNADIDLTPGAGQTELWDLFRDKATGGGTTEAGAASVTTSWTTPSNYKWAAAGVSVKPFIAETYQDQFTASGSFAGDDGTLSWSNDWQETGESDGAGAGAVYVGTNANVGEQGLFVGTGTEAWRQADLSGATSATLSFDFAVVGFDGGESAALEISMDGISWTTLDTFTGTGSDTSLSSRSYDISSYIDTDTRIRLNGSALDNADDFLFVDNVFIGDPIREISSEGAGSAVATDMDASGNYVTVYSVDGQDGSGWGVYVQRYNTAGVAVGSEIRVNQTTSGNQRYASVGMSDTGEFVVTWTGYDDGTTSSVYARQFNADGTADGDEFRVNTENTGAQSNASIDVDASGNYIIVWQGNGPSDSDGVFYRRFNADGSAIDATDTIAHTATDGTLTEHDPVVAWLTGGKFVVAWDEGDFAKFTRFDAAGSPLGAERVSIDSGAWPSVTSGLSIDSNASGQFAIAYKHEGLGAATYARAFNEDGTDLFTNGDSSTNWASVDGSSSLNPSVAIDDSGKVIVAYQTTASGGDIELLTIESDGQELAPAITLVSDVGDQGMPAIAIMDASNYAVVWNDSTDSNIAASAISSDTPPTIDLDANDSSGATGNAYSSAYANGMNIVDSDVSINDVDGDLLTITIINGNITDGSDENITLAGTDFPLDADKTATNRNVGGVFVDVVFTDATQTFSITANGGGGLTATDAQTVLANITYRNDQGPATGPGTRTFSISVNDGTFNSLVAVNTVDVSAANSAPTFTSPATFNSVENSSGIGTVVATDGDVPADTLTYSLTGGVDQALFSIDGSSGALSFILPPDFEAPSDSNTDNVYEVEVTVNDGNGGITAQTINVTVTDEAIDQQSLLLSTENDVTGGPDIGSWSSGAILQLSDPNLAMEPGTSDGTFSSTFDLDSFAALNGDGNTRTGSLHFVSQPITIAGSYALLPGDMVFSVRDNETFTNSDNITTLSVTKNDVVVFRPDNLANYPGGGTFEILLQDPVGAEILALSLVEQDTWVGDALLPAGTFLITMSGGAEDSNIYHITPTGVGGSTSISETQPGTMIVDGADIGISAKIMGIELIEQDSVIGGIDLQAGQILVTLDGSGTIGSNSLSVNKYDIFVIDATTTGAGTTAATAALLVEGTDLGLDTATASPFSLALIPGANQAPIIFSDLGGATAAVSVAENTTAVTTVAASDPELDALTYSIVGGADASKFSIDASSGVLTFVAAPDFEAPTDTGSDNGYEVQVTASDGLGGIDTQTITITVSNANESPAGAVTIDDTTPMRGYTLVVSNTIADPDGIVGAVSYQWMSNGSDIAGAVGNTYIPKQADIGTTLSVRASYTDGSGATETVTSASTSAVGDPYFLDDFSSVSYAGDDGTLSWSNSWQEVGESNGAGSGDLSIESNVGSNSLSITGGGLAIWRSADLTGASSAVLKVDFSRINLESDDFIVINVSDNGGASWTTIDNLGGPGDDGFYWRASYDISAYINADTRIGFETVGFGQGNDKFAIDNVRIDLNTLNIDPTADASAGAPYSINEGDSVVLDGSDSADANGDTLTYLWDLNNDGVYGDVIGETPTVDWATLQSFGIDDDGSYTIGLKVDDGKGGMATTITNLTVANVAPVLTVTGNTTASIGATYTLNFSATDPGDDVIASWTINWGDGAIETVAGSATSATHVYTNGGFTNNILVSATDEDSGVNSSYIHNDLYVGHYAIDSGVYRIQGAWGAAPAEFGTGGQIDNAIQPIIGPDGYVYIVGETSNNVRVFDGSDGSFISQVVDPGEGGLLEAGGIAFGPDGNLYVTDYDNNSVKQYDASGAYITDFVSGGSGGLTRAYGLAFTNDGHLLVGSYNQSQIYRYDASNGNFVDIFVKSADNGGMGASEQFTFGPDGNLYVADVLDEKILRFNGTTGAFIDEFVAANVGGLNKPNGLAFGPDGDLYVSDSQDGVILRFDGTSGAYIDDYVTGLDKPSMIAFDPDVQVTISAAPNSAPVAVDVSYTLAEDATLASVSDWYDAQWSYRVSLTFDNSARSTHLTDFPVLVTLDATTIDYSKTQNAGEDLRFVDSDGTLLNHQIEQWNESGTSYVWVSIPQIDASSNTDSIELYYGNDAAANGEAAPSAWSNNYEAVYHLGNGGSDSTSNFNSGTASNTTATNGQIGDGQSFNGTDSSIDVPTSASINNLFNGGGTVSAWINPSSWGESGLGRIINKANSVSADVGWSLEMDQTNQTVLFEHGFDGQLGRWRVDANLPLDTWQLVTVVYDSSSAANVPVIYLNGVAQTLMAVGLNGTQTPLGTAQDDSAIDLSIGNRSGNTDRTFDGIIDEAVLLSSAQTADWVSAQYASQTRSLVSFDAKETVVNVLNNDTDPENDALTAVLNTGPSNADSFTLNADGSFTYTPTSGFNGTDSFTYWADDGTDRSNLATVTLNVVGNNGIPTAVDDTYTLQQDTTLVIDPLSGLLSNDSDPESDPMSLLYYSMPSNGTLSLNADGSFNYTPNAGYTGADSFTYVVSDGQEAITHEWRLGGNAVDAVGAADGTVSGATQVGGVYGTALDFDGNDYATLPDVAYSDEFTLSLWFKMDDNNGTGYRYIYDHGTAGAQNGLIVAFLENANTNTSDVLRTVFSDSDDATSYSGLDINVTTHGLANGQWHQYTLSTSKANGAEVYIDGNLLATSNRGGDAMDPSGDIYIGARSDLSSVRFFDGSIDNVQLYSRALSASEASSLYDGGSARGTVSLTINASPTTTGISDINVIVNSADRFINIASLFTDAEDASSDLVYSITSNTNSALVTAGVDNTADTLTLGFAAGQTGTGDLTIRATDSTGAFVESSLTVTVLTAEGVTQQIPSSQTLVEDGSLTFSTANGNAVSVSVGTSGNDLVRVSLSITDGTLNLASTSGVTVDSGSNGSSSMVIIGLENNINTALNGLIFTPDPEFNGSVNLQVVSDLAYGMLAQYSFDNTSDIGQNDSPYGTDNAAVNGATSQTDGSQGNVASFDGDDYLRVDSDFGTPANLTLAAWVNLDDTFRNADIINLGGSVTIRLDDINTGDGVTGFYNGGSWNHTNAGLYINGTGWHHIAYSIDSGTDLQTIYVDGIAMATTTYTDAINYTQSHTTIGSHQNQSSYFMTGAVDDVRIYDRVLTDEEVSALAVSQSSVSNSIGVSVTSDNDVPTSTGLADILLDEDALTSVVALHAAFADIEDADSSLTLTVQSNSNATLFSNIQIDQVAGTMTLSYAADANGSATVVIRATDSGSLFVDTAFDVTLNPVNDAPVITSTSTANVSENTALTTVITASDIDSPTNTISYSITGGADAARFSIDASSGNLSFVSLPDFETPDDANADDVYEITIQATDNLGASDQINFVLSLTDIDEQPALQINTLTQNYTEDTPLNLGNIEVSDPDSTNIQVTVALANPAIGSLTTSPSPSGTELSPQAANHQWTISGTVTEVNAALDTLFFVPAENTNEDVVINITVVDGVSTTTGTKTLYAIPVADKPSVSNSTATLGTPSNPISILPHQEDGAEVSFFKITEITNGTLTLSDGSAITDGDFISIEQASSGVIFTPTVSADGSFIAQASADGLSISSQSEPVTAEITFQAAALPVQEPEADISESVTETPELEESSSQELEQEDNLEELIVGEAPATDNGAGNQGSVGDEDQVALIKKDDSDDSNSDRDLFNQNIQSVSLDRYANSQSSLLLKLLEESESIAIENVANQSFEQLFMSFDSLLEENGKLVDNQVGVVGSAVTVATGLSVGYVVWMIRGGMLVSSLLFSLPAWQIADPLPVLNAARKTNNDDDESLESILEKRARENAAKEKLKDMKNNKTELESGMDA